MDVEPTPSIDEAPNGGRCERLPEDMQVAIMQVWKEVFQREEIALDDNFFELGGNSLLGMDLAELLAVRLDIQIPVIAIFQYPSVREMAAIVACHGEWP